jgi:tetrahydromethanopterin:alpha-L-glutamate ligase
LKIPIFTEDPGWHGARLKEAFAKQGIDAVFVSLQDCVINLYGAKPNFANPSIQIPHFDALPPAVFVRGVSGGTMQQVITRLNILHMLSMLNVKIYNDVKAIERTVDKAMTSFLLQENRVSTPATWVSESRAQVEQLRQMAKQNNQTLVLKPLFGSQGLGVRQLLADEALPVPMQQFVDGVYYFQQLIETANAPHDYRVFVINGKVVAAMKRVGSSWVNNIAAGGRCEGVNVLTNQEMAGLALQAASALDIDYCGVDIIQSVTGEYYVLEVNSMPAWKGLQSVAEVDIAELLVNDFLNMLKV